MPGSAQPSVLIVGAGPTGLVLATELFYRGSNVRLIEKMRSPAKHSRACTVHSRTLEAFETVGVSDNIVNGALKTVSMQYHFLGEDENVTDSVKLPFSSDVISGRFPYFCTLPQSSIEAECRRRFEDLGGTIEWGVSLESFEEVDDGVTAWLSGGKSEAEHRTEKTKFSYLVGCDGARSTVRKCLNLEFAGTVYSGMYMKLMDVGLNKTVPDKYGPEAYHYFIMRGAMLMLAKMGPSDDYAIMSVTFGGMGINCAIQDGFNLGWRLAGVCQKVLNPSIVYDYESERRPIARKVLEGAEILHNIVLAHDHGLAKRLAMVTSENWVRNAIRIISGNTFSYAREDVEKVRSSRSDTEEVDLAAGDHAPDIWVASVPGKTHCTFRLSRLPCKYFILVSFTPYEDNLDDLRDLVEKNIVTVVHAVKLYAESSTQDIDGLLYSKYGRHDLALIRPDRYVLALLGKENAGQSVRKALANIGVRDGGLIN